MYQIQLARMVSVFPSTSEPVSTLKKHTHIETKQNIYKENPYSPKLESFPCKDS